MKIPRLLLLTSFIFISSNVFSQHLPPSYQGMLNEFVEYFSQVRGSNSVTKGETVLSVLSEEKIALRFKHKKTLKNLTFEKVPDEESNLVWKAVNQLTIDMIYKYEGDVRKELEKMLKLAEKKSKE